jgi:hypothetical protein
MSKTFSIFSPADTPGPCFFFPLNAEAPNQMSITGKQIFQNKEPFLNIGLSSTMSTSTSTHEGYILQFMK